jgi:hypothetical protein
MTGKIYISYRRDDAPDITEALYRHLTEEFGAADFIRTLPDRLDRVEVLKSRVAEADVVLAVIGPHWAELTSARARDPDDFVTIELNVALEQAKPVIPVLIGGASMPRRETLPQPIRALALRNPVALSPARFADDCKGLFAALRKWVKLLGRADAEHTAPETKHQQREAEERAQAQRAELLNLLQGAARIAAEEERAKAQRAELLNLVQEEQSAREERAKAQRAELRNLVPASAKTKVFISYRRDDSRYQAQKIHAGFCKVVPRDHVFMDIDSIKPGVNFRKTLKNWVDQCGVLLALIGPGWIDATDRTGRRRLDDPNDFVRVEISAALARGIPVVPILLDGTPLPEPGLLPDDINELVEMQAEFVEFRTFDTDVARLIQKLGLGPTADDR